MFFEYYPDINRKEFNELNFKDKREFLIKYFENVKFKNTELLTEKIDQYTNCWNIHKIKITETLESIFSISLIDKFNDLNCNISFFPINPRYLTQNSYDIFYLNSTKYALWVGLHEIIHFVWFYVWNNYFNDSYLEYETPHLKWILSEMVVDCIMKDERLVKIDDVFKKDSAYSYFYNMEIDKNPILETLKQMYTTMEIKEFMKNSYDYCLKFEREIKEHIKQSES